MPQCPNTSVAVLFDQLYTLRQASGTNRAPCAWPTCAFALVFWACSSLVAHAVRWRLAAQVEPCGRRRTEGVFVVRGVRGAGSHRAGVVDATGPVRVCARRQHDGRTRRHFFRRPRHGDSRPVRQSRQRSEALSGGGVERRSAMVRRCHVVPGFLCVCLSLFLSLQLCVVL